MKIHEYQAKKIICKYGIAVPRGFLASTPSQAKQAYKSLKRKRCVVKAQVLAGARGKSGGIKLCKNIDEVGRAASSMLGKQLTTHQTQAGGIIVKKILVEEAVDIKDEFYLGAVIDRSAGRAVIIASRSGGMEIEEVSRKCPNRIIKEVMDPFAGFMPHQARKIASSLGMREPKLLQQAIKTIMALSRIFIECDCSLIEINPWALTKDSHLIALDAKIAFDDSALFRHHELMALHDKNDGTFLERKAARYGLAYVGLGGNIGCLVNGAGLAMATMDLIKLSGGEPANFLDVGGGADLKQVMAAFEILFLDERLNAVLVNIFGGIMKCDIIAQGIVAAVKKVKPKMPIVVRFEGTNVEEAKEILDRSRFDFITAEDMQDAAEKAVEAARS